MDSVVYRSFLCIHQEDRFFDRDITTNKWGANFILNRAYNIKAKIEHQNNEELNNLNNSTILWNKTELQTSITKTFFKMV